MFDRVKAHEIADELDEPVREARKLAKKFNLDPYPVNYWIVNQDEMNELIAYGGFHTRYPHWRWGMKFDKQRKQREFLGGKAFEIVNNDNPSNAFLQESNSIADQKAVITHVEGHSDFFAQNEWFQLFSGEDMSAAEMVEKHADRVEEIIQNPDVSRDDVEKWIDSVLCIEDNIDQHREFNWGEKIVDGGTEDRESELLEELEDSLSVSDEVREEIFNEEWLEEQQNTDSSMSDSKEDDLLLYLYKHGKQFDEDKGKAVEFEDWQRDIIEILRAESYYFAPQKMTKTMNEGWAAFWESKMMADETFAGSDEFLNYADHQAQVLGSPGLNPYKLGIELWKYIENRTNRREVVRKILRTEGVTPHNFGDKVDFERVREMLEPDDEITSISSDSLDSLDPDDSRVDAENLALAREGEIDVDKYPWKVLTYEGLCQRHYSLLKRENRGFLNKIGSSELEEISRYLIDLDRYETIEEAVNDVEYSAGWDRMREVRMSHNDVTFLDEFLTQEFVDNEGYFTYEFSQQTGGYHAASTDVSNVKKKLLVEFTNFGKPTVTVLDGNYNNKGELLLAHEFNGIQMHIDKAKKVLTRLYELWGRPVNIVTVSMEVTEEEKEIAKRRGREPEPTVKPLKIRWDGDNFTEEKPNDDEEIADAVFTSSVDYDTTPDEWLN